MAKKICVICGKEGYSFLPFCYEHLQDQKAGTIIKCQCGTWHYANKTCPKCEISQAQTISKNTTTDLTCLICGEPSNGKHFCKECYQKYKDRAVDIRITHCRETEILDEYGNLIYTCDDGRKVRSRAEAIICSWLFNNKIRVKYEETIFYKNETGETKQLKPDFYLPDYNLYIEYNEREDVEYKKKKAFAMNEYNKLNLKVVVMTGKDLQNVGAFIKPMLITN